METLPVASLNVDITEFMDREDVSETVLKLQQELQSNDHVMLNMLEEGRHADIILTAQGGSVKAHRSVLSTVSPVFEAMFKHDMKEQLSSTVHIPDMTIQSLKIFLLVLYTMDDYVSITKYTLRPILPVLNIGIDKHWDEFFRGVSKYQVFRRRIEPLLKDALQRRLTPDNCWEYYDISLQFPEESWYSEESCSDVVRQYIVEKFHKVVQSANFLAEMKRDVDRVYSILIEADRKSHLLLKALQNEKPVQPSAKRRKAS